MSELTPPAEQCGTGSLLMIGEGRERMPSGAPYQPAFWVGEQSIILGLVTDDQGHPLGYAEADLPPGWEDTEFIARPVGRPSSPGPASSLRTTTTSSRTQLPPLSSAP